MICNTSDFSTWKDFPRGLRVLLLNEDADAASDMKSKLETMDYIVSVFSSVNEALSAASGKAESFHVAILEVTSSNSDGIFKFLESAQDLPTVMTSNLHCLSIMMKCIACGAVEFLKRPISDEKLTNIWQHVVHQAFNSGKESLKPVKESVVSMLQLTEDDHGDKFPAPSTPQLDQGKHLSDDGDYQENTNVSSEKESGEQDGESKFVESTCLAVKKEEGEQGKSRIFGSRLNRKKIKVDWTAELHRKFVQAVEQLGIDQAIPSKILEHMKEEGLTRHNVASHLQKYRMHRRNTQPKQDERRCQIQRSYPVMAYPAYHSLPYQTIWVPPTFPPWPALESWQWRPYPGIQADAFGSPVMHPYTGVLQSYQGAAEKQIGCHQQPSAEVVDEVVKEAMSKPWLPLPLGLKPPSADCVLAELSRQGIPAVPFSDDRHF